MSSDLSAIISGAVADAGLSEGDSGSAETTDTVEATDTSSDDGGSSEESPAAETAADAAPAATAEPSEEDELRALEQELVGKTPNLAKGRISVSRHQAVLTRARRKAEAELKAASEKYSKYDSQEWQEREAAIQLAEQHPDVFFQHVLMQSPAYARLIEAEFERRGQKVPKAVADAAAAEEPALGEEPKPDVLDANGNLVYSAEASKKLIDWHLQQTKRATSKELQDLNAKVQPILDARKEAEIRSEYRQRASTMLEEARASWEGFAENEAAVYEYLMKPENLRLSLDQGYRAVVVPLLKGQREKLEADIRKEVIASLSVTPAKKPVRPGLPAVTADDADAPRDTAALIREAMSSANLS